LIFATFAILKKIAGIRIPPVYQRTKHKAKIYALGSAFLSTLISIVFNPV